MFNYVAEARGGPPQEGEERDFSISSFFSFPLSFYFTFARILALLPWMLLRFGWRIYGSYILVDISKYLFY